uniref:Uncharacterized protein n=1 Tax=Arundo donax TaxID=35708 RepID=A0A0A9DEW9_ARUDO
MSSSSCIIEFTVVKVSLDAPDELIKKVTSTFFIIKDCPVRNHPSVDLKIVLLP